MPDAAPPDPEIEVTWSDVLTPGKAELAERPDPFEMLRIPGATGEQFSLETARSLAAFSLLIYRERERRSILERHGLTERAFLEAAATTCSIIEPAGDAVGAAVIVFRGTAELRNWLTNLQSIPKAWGGGGHVHGGFADAHQELWKRLRPLMRELAEAGRPIFLTGHSLGGALGTLALSEFRHLQTKPVPVHAYTFGSPRVGNIDFARSLEDAQLFRVVRNQDLVTRFPLPFSPSRRLSFRHAGHAFFLDASFTLHARGQEDLDEESASLSQVKGLAKTASSTFGKPHPPSFLSDHAPVAYIDGLRRAAGS